MLRANVHAQKTLMAMKSNKAMLRTVDKMSDDQPIPSCSLQLFL